MLENSASSGTIRIDPQVMNPDTKISAMFPDSARLGGSELVSFHVVKEQSVGTSELVEDMGGGFTFLVAGRGVQLVSHIVQSRNVIPE